MTDDEAMKILQLTPVDFDYIEAYGGEKNQHGLIAEDTIDIIPSSDFKVTDEVLRRNTVLPQNRIGETCTEHEVNFVCRREDGSYVSSRTMQHVSRIVHEQLTCT